MSSPAPSNDPIDLATVLRTVDGLAEEVGRLRSRVQDLEEERRRTVVGGLARFWGRSAKDGGPLPPLPAEGLDLGVLYFGGMRRRPICFAKDLLRAYGCDTRRTALSFIGADVLEVVLPQAQVEGFTLSLVGHKHLPLPNYDPASPMRVTKRGLSPLDRLAMARASCIRRWRLVQSRMVSSEFIEFFEARISALATSASSSAPSLASVPAPTPAPRLAPAPAPAPPSSSHPLDPPSPQPRSASSPPPARSASSPPPVRSAAPSRGPTPHPAPPSRPSSSQEVYIPTPPFQPLQTSLTKEEVARRNEEDARREAEEDLRAAEEAEYRFCHRVGCFRPESDLEERTGNKLLRCARCAGIGRIVFYCGKECQAAAWKHHKLICGKLGAD